jgi:hypothetical protein
MKAILAGALLALTATTAMADEPHTFNYTYSNLSRQQRDQLWSQSVAEWKEHSATHADSQPKKECSTTVAGGKSYTFCNMTVSYYNNPNSWVPITLSWDYDVLPGERARCLVFVLADPPTRHCLSVEGGIEFVQTWDHGIWR